jgi:hypothetical protein
MTSHPSAPVGRRRPARIAAASAHLLTAVTRRNRQARLKRYAIAAVLVVAAAVAWPLSISATSASAAGTTNFYIDPVNGSDSNPGTSVSSAFQTIAKAQSAVRAVDTNMTGNITVNLRGGTYTLSSTADFTAADSGTNGFNVVWQAYNGETPVISSATRVSGWTSVGGGIYSAPVASGLDFRQMYVNGVRATIARSADTGSYYQLKSVDNTNQRLGILASQISNWSNFSSVEMVLQTQWGESYLPLQSYTTSGGIASVAINSAMANILFQRPYPILAVGSPFYFENAYEFLNQPGEYYLNTSTHTVYYIPRPGENMASADVEVPTLQTLFDIEGADLSTPVHNLQFSGLTFADTTWTLPSTTGELNAQGGNYNLSANMSNQQYVARPPAGVYVADANSINFTGNTFTRMGSTALDLHHGVHNSSVVGNLIYDTAGNGVMIGKFSDPTVEYHTVYNPPTSPAGESAQEVVTGVTVTDNLITRTGEDYFGTAGINAGYVNSTIINHNDVSDSPWAGISVGWGWTSASNALGNNQISYNNISDVMNTLCDSAGIYHLSDDPGTVITGNYIHDVVHGPTACSSATAGIYLDEGSNNMSATNNVLSDTDNFIVQNHNGSSVTVSGNASSGSSIIEAAGLESAYTGLHARLDLAYNKPASASSTYSSGFSAAQANDNNAATGWSPTGSDTAAWWQTDLGASYSFSQFTLTTRQDIDQPTTRSGFEIRASNDPTFATYAVIGRVDSRAVPYGGSITRNVTTPQQYRYVRVAKTDGQYFFMSEFSIQAGNGSIPAASAPSFNPSQYYTLASVNSGKLLDDYNNSTSDGAAVDQWMANSGDNQQWQIQNVTGNLYKIVNRHSGKALDLYNNSHNTGATIDQWTWNNGNNQLWYFAAQPDGSWVIRNFESGQVLDVAGGSTANGAAIDQWTPISQTNQEWTIS